MRIVKSQALTALGAENSLLGVQMGKCRRQISKFCGMHASGMSGRGAQALEQKLRMQAAIVVAHLSFYESLRAANERHAQLVSALPETDGGVLDTNAAKQRIDAAQRQISALQAQMDGAIAQARLVNSSLSDALESGEMDEWDATVSFVSIDAIRERYEALIYSQRLIVKVNQEILQRAHQYESDSKSAYESVQTGYIREATSASESFSSGRGWGDCAWVSKMYANRSLRLASELGEDKVERGVLEKFLHGEYKTDSAFAYGEARGTVSGHGIAAAGAVSGSVLSVDASYVPYGEDAKKRGKNDRSLSFGGEAKVGLTAAQAKLEGDVGGLLGVSMEGKALTGALSGTLGASLFSDGSFGPSIEAGAKAVGSVMEGGTDAVIGIEDYNVHGKAQGKLLTGEAEAKVKASAEGLEAVVGAEAYAATGKLSAGLTILGTRFDADLDAKVGGVGAKAAAKVGIQAVEGEVGLGLGLGLGVKLRVDWSATVGAFDNTVRSFSSWWDELRGNFGLRK